MTGFDYTALIGREMENGLIRLQAIEPYNYAAAFESVYGGSIRWRPYVDRYDAAWFQGRALALELWCDRMSATMRLREALADDAVESRPASFGPDGDAIPER